MTRMSGSAWTAADFVRRPRARCRRIGYVPHGGVSRDDLAPNLRTVPFERSAVIVYRVETDRIRIVDVFYGGRDYEALHHRAPPEP